MVVNEYICSGHEPNVVAFAQSTDHVSQIVKYCASKRIPVVPFGTGTGLEGTTDAIFHLNYCFLIVQQAVLQLFTLVIVVVFCIDQRRTIELLGWCMSRFKLYE